MGPGGPAKNPKISTKKSRNHTKKIQKQTKKIQKPYQKNPETDQKNPKTIPKKSRNRPQKSRNTEPAGPSRSGPAQSPAHGRRPVDRCVEEVDEAAPLDEEEVLVMDSAWLALHVEPGSPWDNDVPVEMVE